MNQKLIIGIVAIIIIAVVAGIYAPRSKTEMVKNDVIQNENSATDQKKDKAMMDDSHVLGVLFSKGKIMTVWEMNEIATLDHDITLKNGTKVSVDGKITDASSNTIVLKDGQELTTDGAVQMVDISKMMMAEGGFTMNKGDTIEKGNEDMITKWGSYESYSPEKIPSAAAKGDVVLDFYAGWCPTCRALRSDIQANLKNIPENLTILEVNYDNSINLKKKYSVSLQSTMVQVDKDGKLIKKWNMMSLKPTLVTFLSELRK